MEMIKALIFDWGNTIMRDFDYPGPMWTWEKNEWISGAKGVLTILSKKYCCVIATSADQSNTQDMRKALARIDAEKYFCFFFSQKELGVKKPDVKFFEKTLNLSGFNATEAVMIGDQYEKDIVGAKTAGMQTVLLNEKESADNFPAADFVITNMIQLLDIY